MLSIKLSPVGRKRQITYRIVVAEKRSKLKGKYIENIGWVDPHADKFKVDKERALYWMSAGGAKPTDSVYNLLVKAGIIDGPKKPVHAKKKISEEEAAKEAEAKASENNAPSEDNTESTEEESLEKEGDNVSEEKEGEVAEEEKVEEKTEEKPDEEEPKQEEAPKPEEEVQENKETEEEKGKE